MSEQLKPVGVYRQALEEIAAKIKANHVAAGTNHDCFTCRVYQIACAALANPDAIGDQRGPRE